MNAQPRMSDQDRSLHGFHDRDMPSAIEAEMALLGALMMNAQASAEIIDRVAAEDFSDPINAEIFRICLEQIAKGKRPNPVTLKAALPEIQIGEKTISQYLASLAANAVNVVNAPDYADAIRYSGARRTLINLGGRITDVGVKLADEVLLLEEVDALATRLTECRAKIAGSEGSGTSFADAMDRALDRTDKAQRGEDESGIDCGFMAVTRLVGPLTPGQLVIIGGGTKQGKSALAQQMGMGAARNGWPVFYYSGEMGADELAMREISRETGISVSRQKRGSVSDQEYEQMVVARSHLAKLPWHIQDKRRTLDQLERELEAFVKRNGQCLVVVDSVTLIERDQNSRRVENWAFAEIVTDRLKGIARKLESPILALSQLKKNTFVVDKPGYGKKVDASLYKNVVNRRPRFSDILGACERDADHVLIPFNPEPILMEIEPAEGSEEHVYWEEVLEANKGRAEIILALSREQRWPRKQAVLWDGTRTTFEMQGESQKGLF